MVINESNLYVDILTTQYNNKKLLIIMAEEYTSLKILYIKSKEDKSW